MDLITVDITQLEDTPRSLDLINKIQTVDIIANAASTIGYEILTSLGARYAREYIKG
jgi:alanine racemase